MRPYFDAAIGVLDERTVDLSSPGQPHTIRSGVEGLFGIGNIVQKQSVNGFDVIDFNVSFAEGISPPQSYEGMSGGGVWRVRLNEAQNAVLGRMLIGVVIRQSEIVEGRRTITCHGAESIYSRLLEAVRQKWPQTNRA